MQVRMIFSRSTSFFISRGRKPSTLRAANSRIRADLLTAAKGLGAEVYMPPLSLCGDNGAMIGAQAYYEFLAGNTADMHLNAYATKSILGEAL